MPVSDICDDAMEDDNSFGQSCAGEDNLNFPYVARHSSHWSIDGQKRQFRCVASFPDIIAASPWK